MQDTIKINISLIIDATGSMSSTLVALRPALSQLCQLMPLFARARFYLAVYRDFDMKGDKIYQCSGPFEATDVERMSQLICKTPADGGDDTPECQKFAFNRLLADLPNGEGNCVVFHFTDAPPHKLPFPTRGNDNSCKEGLSLKVNGLEPDWIKLCQMYQTRKIPVYTIGKLGADSFPYYASLARMTGAELILLNDDRVETILRTVTIVIARSLGYDECDLSGLASLIRITDTNFDSITTENSPLFSGLKCQQVKFTDGQDQVEVKNIFKVCSRQQIETRYKTEVDFQTVCYDNFVRLIKAGHILALTYNPLLGSLYRQMSKRSKLAQLDARREELNILMSTTVQKLKNTDARTYEQVAKWLEESYNRLEEINELIMTSNGPIVPFLTLQIAERMTKKDLSLACKIPMPQNLRKLGELVSNITLVETQPKTMPEVFVPLSVSDEDLFSLLSHLMCPGVKLDFRPAVILALVALNGKNAIIAERALKFLHNNCGKWFDKESSEMYLFGFIKLVLRLNTEYQGILTADEVEYLLPFHKISSLKYNNTEMDCTRKFKLIPEHGKKYRDYKVVCKLCQQYRSSTIMTPQGCGMCLSYSPELLRTLTDPEKVFSFLFDCTTCGSRYAVRNLDGLKAKPKCHYCRQMPPVAPAKIPKVVCTVCDIGMILPDNTNINATNTNFMCALCAENDGKERLETIQVRVHDLLKQNPSLVQHLLGLEIDIKNLTSTESLMSLRNKFTVIASPPRFEGLMYDNRPILNSSIVLDKLREIVSTGSVGTETCLICYRECIHAEMDAICYHKKCQARACKGCIQNWFSGNKPGQRILHNRITCPSCKKIPVKGLAYANPDVKTIISQKVVYDLDWHYAWCINCNKVKEYMERQCAGPDPMEINNYMCEDCMKPGKHKACPFCGLATVKASGCDHLECPKEHGGCGVHWCYRCDAPNVFHSTNPKDIYDHLHDVHGNIWGAVADVDGADVDINDDEDDISDDGDVSDYD